MADQEISNTSDQTTNTRLKTLKSKKTLIILGVLLLFGAAAGASYFYMQRKNTTTATQKPLVEFPEPSKGLDSVIQQADQLAGPSATQEAVKLLEDNFSKAKTPLDKFLVASRLSSLYYKQGVWEKCVSWSETSIATEYPGSAGSYTLLAKCADLLGDKPKAIKAYKFLVDDLVKRDDPVFNSTITEYQNAIKRLET